MAAPLWIERLSANEFRCYRHLELAVSDRPIVLTGPNGAGKTNLLEAISFLAPGRGLRRARLADVGRRESAVRPAPWAVAVEVRTAGGDRRRLGTGRDPAGSGEKRLVRIDGETARSQQALAEIMPVVWLTPAMDGLFRDGSAGRRRFLDRLVYGFDPRHAGRLAAYTHALRERARLLKARRNDRGRNDREWLTALEETMARHGVAVAAARLAMVERLNEAAAAGRHFPKARLAVEGSLERALSDGPALEAEDGLVTALAASRHVDGEHGGAAEGPHRSDLAVVHAGKALPAEHCSTGEQKALVVSIVLAHARLVTAERGAAPVLLLDEVAAHLDAERRRALFAELETLGAQAWLTGTEPGLFAELGERARFLHVEEARVAETLPPQAA